MNKQTLQEKPHGTPYFPFEAFSQFDSTGSYFLFLTTGMTNWNLSMSQKDP